MQKGWDLSLVGFPFSETHSHLSQEHGTKKCIHVRLPLMVRTCKLSPNVKDLVPIWSSSPIRVHNWIRTYKAGPSVNQPLRSHLHIEGAFGHFDDYLLCILRVAPSATVYWHVHYNFNEVQVYYAVWTCIYTNGITSSKRSGHHEHWPV
jgi:hypothetical protein